MTDIKSMEEQLKFMKLDVKSLKIKYQTPRFANIAHRHTIRKDNRIDARIDVHGRRFFLRTVDSILESEEVCLYVSKKINELWKATPVRKVKEKKEKKVVSKPKQKEVLFYHLLYMS